MEEIIARPFQTLKPEWNARQRRLGRPKGKPELVKIYDFIDKKLGKATPYGIYNLSKNLGWVNVGSTTSRDCGGAQNVRSN